MAFDLGKFGKQLGDFAQEAKETFAQSSTPPPSQPAPQNAAPARPLAPPPQAPGYPSDAGYTPDDRAYGSAYLRTQASKPLSEAMKLDSTQIIMGSTEENGPVGIVWDLMKAPAHAMTFGPTRKGGKGTSAIIPALLSYTAGSRLVIDPKGENYFAVKQRSETAGHRVVLMDPWNEANRRYGSKIGVTEPVTRFNPLSSLKPGSADFADDVAAIADALVVVPDSVNRHFDESARELVAGCIAAVVEDNPGIASLRDVREMLTLSDDDLARVVTDLVTNNPKSLAARKLRRFTKSNDEISSVRSTAETQTSFLDSETLLDAMETDDPPFDLSELATTKVSLFLVLPVDRLETHGRWMRLIITLAIRAIARQDTPPKAPVLFVLDEMGTIGRLAMVETAFGLMAGLGIRLWGFLQDIVQLQGLYPKTWETFISNSSVIQILKAHDPTTSEYVSRYLGNSTVNAKTGSATFKQKKWDYPGQFMEIVKRKAAENLDSRSTLDKLRAGPVNQAEETSAMVNVIDLMAKRGMTPDYQTVWEDDSQLIARPLLDPDEVRRMDDARCLLLLPGSRPIAQYRTVYFKHPLFTGLYRPNPYFGKPVSQASSTS